MSELANDNTAAPTSIMSHVSIGTNDMARSTAFYDAVMEALGYGRVMEHGEFAVAYGTAFPEFWVQAPHDKKPAGTPSNGTHFAFLATTKDAVDAFHAAALAHGGTCDGPPGFRPEYGEPYYGAFVCDPDGHKIEAMIWDRPMTGDG
ncbi:MAG: VOC family protein [Rhodospirillaceae bacterium]|jgi:catechol 2,3-dioxygenase-like lactoylglutathione lyase family enzyme|nr:VOC family protein [Rhodospirillaceae bacterium]MBT5241484.1 VOC family protein [Rhodospirillaceae bacterium]MBT5566246.1 VOC family protein [Rhodospirillaceae bacterium]MBT6088964.1 VOC family protein [Rhodospirillaceae bacterium]MBT6961878.1 VOC family protein [Rhodospirillaceae bacterium]